MTVSIEVLNAIRLNASTEYQTRIPEATRTNLATIGKALETYTLLTNEFTNLLVKLGMTIMSDKMFTNKLARFKYGSVINGSDIEEIFVGMIAGVAFDKTGANPLGRRKPDNINVLYHRQNMQETYEISVSDEQVKNAFKSEAGVQNLLTSLVNSMYSGANYDEYVTMKELLADYKDGVTYLYQDYEVADITDEASAKDFVKTVRKAAADMSYVSTSFNHAGVKTYTDKSDMVLFVNKDVIAEVDVEVLAKAFNMGKTNFEPTIVEVDDFGSMPDTLGLLIDKDFFRVFDTLRTMESIRNPQGLFTNYFLHVWQIQSVSKFKNAIRFVKHTA